MNRGLYQLSYAAIFMSAVSRRARIIISAKGGFVNHFFRRFPRKNSRFPGKEGADAGKIDETGEKR